ncbi:MAG: hypothetical protein ACRDVE_02110 [Actinocrinis sp.]
MPLTSMFAHAPANRLSEAPSATATVQPSTADGAPRGTHQASSYSDSLDPAFGALSTAQLGRTSRTWAEPPRRPAGRPPST